MTYRNTGPEVYDYNRGSYDPYHNPSNNFSGQQNVSPVFNQENGTVTPVNPSINTHPVKAELRGSAAGRRGSKYADYTQRAK